MKGVLKIFPVLAAGALVVLLLVGLGSGGPRRDLEATLKKLRQDGYKTDLAEFDFSTTAEQRRRSVALSSSGIFSIGLAPERLDYMASVGSNDALVLWQLPELPSRQGGDGWEEVRTLIDEKREVLDGVAKAVLSGPLKYDLQAKAGASMPLPHLSSMRNLGQCFAERAMVQLHDLKIVHGEGVHDIAFLDHHNDIWTNLLVVTRFVTAWEPEPSEISHMVRFTCAELAFKTTWQVLQAGGWDDEHLAGLQHEWEGVDYFKGLPETEAFSRATMTAAFEFQRKQPLRTGISAGQIIHSPGDAWANVKSALQDYRYRHRGSYEDEQAMLLDYRDREQQMRDAIKDTTWLEMRQSPAATNLPITPLSPALLARRRPNPGGPMFGGTPLLGRIRVMRSPSLLARAAEAEAQRRLLITAIALERFHARHGRYPQTLAELSPELLSKPPMDFMDGKPLRYHLGDDGHFLLYSLGLDCADHGGQFVPMFYRQPGISSMPGARLGVESAGRLALYNRNGAQQSDILWPRPAPFSEVNAELEREQHQEEARRAGLEAQMAEAENTAELRRQEKVKELLDRIEDRANSPSSFSPAPDPVYKARPLSEWLANTNVPGTNHASMNQLLTLKQIMTGDEPATATFELPLRYDSVTNLGELFLLVDGQIDNDSDDGFDFGREQTLQRATNGDCLIAWNTLYDAPGQHVVQAGFTLTREAPRRLPSDEDSLNPIRTAGPLMPYYSSNLCQFSEMYSHFEPGRAVFYAKLVESNGLYSIEVKSPMGQHVRAFNGNTTNGVIKVPWDMTDEQGRKYTNDSLEISYEIKLPDSGRTQVIK